MVIGQGSFGRVLLAEYRGTQVAVKRVIPPRKGDGSSKSASDGGPGIDFGGSDDVTGSSNATRESGDPSQMIGSILDKALSVIDDVSERDTSMRSLPDDLKRDKDLEANEIIKNQPNRTRTPPPVTKSRTNGNGDNFGTSSGGILKNGKYGTRSMNGGMSSMSNSGGTATMSVFKFGSRDAFTKLKKEFVDEMRLLSKLRHPCITTIMGAVVGQDPMLVMEVSL